MRSEEKQSKPTLREKLVNNVVCLLIGLGLMGYFSRDKDGRSVIRGPLTVFADLSSGIAPRTVNEQLQDNPPISIKEYYQRVYSDYLPYLSEEEGAVLLVEPRTRLLDRDMYPGTRFDQRHMVEKALATATERRRLAGLPEPQIHSGFPPARPTDRGFRIPAWAEGTTQLFKPRVALEPVYEEALAALPPPRVPDSQIPRPPSSDDGVVYPR